MGQEDAGNGAGERKEEVKRRERAERGGLSSGRWRPLRTGAAKVKFFEDL